VGSLGYDSATETDTIAWTSGQLNPDSQTCDIVGAGNAHACLVWDALMTASVIVGDVDTYEWPYDPGVVAGDWLCLAGYTPLVQLPDFALPCFVHYVAAACLVAHGDREGAAAERAIGQQKYEKAISVATPRSEAEAPTMVTRNSPLRARWNGGYWPQR
jgi:hypothetical protein